MVKTRRQSAGRVLTRLTTPARKNQGAQQLLYNESWPSDRSIRLSSGDVQLLGSAGKTPVIRKQLLQDDSSLTSFVLSKSLAKRLDATFCVPHNKKSISGILDGDGSLPDSSTEAQPHFRRRLKQKHVDTHAFDAALTESHSKPVRGVVSSLALSADEDQSSPVVSEHFKGRKKGKRSKVDPSAFTAALKDSPQQLAGVSGVLDSDNTSSISSPRARTRFQRRQKTKSADTKAFDAALSESRSKPVRGVALSLSSSADDLSSPMVSEHFKGRRKRSMVDPSAFTAALKDSSQELTGESSILDIEKTASHSSPEPEIHFLRRQKTKKAVTQAFDAVLSESRKTSGVATSFPVLPPDKEESRSSAVATALKNFPHLLSNLPAGFIPIEEYIKQQNSPVAERPFTQRRQKKLSSAKGDPQIFEAAFADSHTSSFSLAVSAAVDQDAASPVLSQPSRRRKLAHLRTSESDPPSSEIQTHVQKTGTPREPDKQAFEAALTESHSKPVRGVVSSLALSADEDQSSPVVSEHFKGRKKRKRSKVDPSAFTAALKDSPQQLAGPASIVPIEEYIKQQNSPVAERPFSQRRQKLSSARGDPQIFEAAFESSSDNTSAIPATGGSESSSSERLPFLNKRQEEDEELKSFDELSSKIGRKNYMHRSMSQTLKTIGHLEQTENETAKKSRTEDLLQESRVSDLANSAKSVQNNVFTKSLREQDTNEEKHQSANLQNSVMSVRRSHLGSIREEKVNQRNSEQFGETHSSLHSTITEKEKNRFAHKERVKNPGIFDGAFDVGSERDSVGSLVKSKGSHAESVRFSNANKEYQDASKWVVFSTLKPTRSSPAPDLSVTDTSGTIISSETSFSRKKRRFRVVRPDHNSDASTSENKNKNLVLSKNREIASRKLEFHKDFVASPKRTPGDTSMHQRKETDPKQMVNETFKKSKTKKPEQESGVPDSKNSTKFIQKSISIESWGQEDSVMEKHQSKNFSEHFEDSNKQVADDVFVGEIENSVPERSRGNSNSSMNQESGTFLSATKGFVSTGSGMLDSQKSQVEDSSQNNRTLDLQKSVKSSNSSNMKKQEDAGGTVQQKPVGNRSIASIRREGIKIPGESIRKKEMKYTQQTLTSLPSWNRGEPLAAHGTELRRKQLEAIVRETKQKLDAAKIQRANSIPKKPVQINEAPKPTQKAAAPKKSTRPMTLLQKLKGGKNSTRLKKPQRWATPRLYKLIIPKCAAKFGELKARRRAEEFVVWLCKQVMTVTHKRNKKIESYQHISDEIKTALYRLGVIRSLMDYFIFIEEYLPFEYRRKVIPCQLGLGVITGIPIPQGTKLLADLKL